MSKVVALGATEELVALVAAGIEVRPCRGGQELEELLAGLRKMGAQFSMSSMRASNLPDQVLAEIAGGGARTVTLAPEAGSERLRQIINKGICEDDILSTVDRLARHGIKQLKLYFMLGLIGKSLELYQ